MGQIELGVGVEDDETSEVVSAGSFTSVDGADSPVVDVGLAKLRTKD